MPSDSKTTRRWLNDIWHHNAMVDGFLAGMSYESFKVKRRKTGERLTAIASTFNASAAKIARHSNG